MKSKRRSRQEEALAADEPPAPTVKKKKKKKPVYVEMDYPARLAIASFVWTLVGWLLAAAAPRLAFLPFIEVVHYLLPAVTVGLIAANLYFAVRELWRQVHPLRLLVITGLQLGLFTTLFFQIYAHLGAEFYDADGPTSAWQWVTFSLGHALRASDIVDFIEAYSLRVQPIKHHGWLVACFVILYHIVIDVFILGILWDAVERIQRQLMKDEGVRYIVRWVAVVVLCVWLVAWLLVAFVIYPWSRIDVPLWFLENLLRVFDFADIMESFDIELHSLPREGINGTLTILCRIFIGVGIAYLLGRKKKPADKRVMTPPDEEPLPYWAKRAGFVCGVLLVLTGFGMLAHLLLGNPALWLAESVGGSSGAQTEAALNGLRRMGPAAKQAIPTLLDARARAQPPVSEDIVRVLGYCGTAAIKPLTKIASGGEEASALVAVAGLVRIGPDSAGGIAQTWSATSFEAVRQRADQELRELGTDAVPGIMAATTLANAERHYQWFQELDRNWLLRSTSNDVAASLQRLPDLLRRLDGNPGGTEFVEICTGLAKCGTAARKTAPRLLDALDERDAPVVSAAESVLLGIGAEVGVELLRRADDPKLRTYDSMQRHADAPYIRLLSRREMWDQKALRDPRALPMMTRILARPDAPGEARTTFLSLMKENGAAGKDAIPVLVTLLGEGDADSRAEVRETLAAIDAGWQKNPLNARAIPALLPRLGALLVPPPPARNRPPSDPAALKEARATAADILAVLGDLDPADGQAVADALVVGEGLFSGNGQVYRARLLKAVELLGPRLRPATPALAKLVLDPQTNVGVKHILVEYLKIIGGEFDALGPAMLSFLGESLASLKLLQDHGKAALPTIERMLQDQQPNPRYFAVWAAEKLEAVAQPLLPTLLALLAEKDSDYQVALRDSLESERLSTRQRVLRALKAVDKDWTRHAAADKALAALIRVAATEPAEAQKRVYALLGELGPAARSLWPDIAQLVLAPHRAFNADTARVLDRIDERWREHEAIKAVIPELCRRFAKGDVSYDVAIRTLGPAAGMELGKALEGATSTVHSFAIEVLSSPALIKDCVPALVGLLSSPALQLTGMVDVLKKIQAADPQWAADPRLKDIIPKVLDQAMTRDAKEHRYQMLCKPLGDKALPYLVGVLERGNSEHRRCALLGIAQIGPPARSAVAAIQKVMDDKDAYVRLHSVEALLSIAPGDKALVDILVPLVVSMESHVLGPVQEALEKLDPHWRKSKALKPVQARLLENLASKDQAVRVCAANSIAVCGRFEGAEPALERMIRSEKDLGTKFHAERVLGQIKAKK